MDMQLRKSSDFRRSASTLAGSFERTGRTQSVHLTLGILSKSQAVFYALSFFWLDGFAVPAPAQVTQTVGAPVLHKLTSCLFQNSNFCLPV